MPISFELIRERARGAASTSTRSRPSACGRSRGSTTTTSTTCRRSGSTGSGSERPAAAPGAHGRRRRRLRPGLRPGRGALLGRRRRSTCACRRRALGGSAVAAAGTHEQKARFLAPLPRGRPAELGRDGDHRAERRLATPPRSRPRAHARRRRVGAERHEDLLHRRRRRVAGRRAASSWCGRRVDKSAGRAGIKSFVVPAGTPGMTLVGLEKKLGIRASDTATLRFENCRVPQRPPARQRAEVKKADPKQTGDKGFKGAMATFDASRPIVAAMAVGVGRAALDFVKEELARQGVALALRRAARAADRDRARPDRDGGRAAGRAAAHLARRAR